MELISREEWAKRAPRVMEALRALARLLERHPDHVRKLLALAECCVSDPQQFVYDIHDGFLFGGMGSISDEATSRAEWNAVVELAEAVEALGIAGDRIRLVLGHKRAPS